MIKDDILNDIEEAYRTFSSFHLHNEDTATPAEMAAALRTAMQAIGLALAKLPRS